MKFLISPPLLALTAVASRDVGDVALELRAESYSLKAAGADKRFRRNLESRLASERLARRERSGSFAASADAAPEQQPAQQPPALADAGSSGAGAGEDETLLLLLATLEAAFPDYDFSSQRSANFERPALAKVVAEVNTYLANLADEESRNPTLHAKLLEGTVCGVGSGSAGDGAFRLGKRARNAATAAAAALASASASPDASLAVPAPAALAAAAIPTSASLPPAYGGPRSPPVLGMGFLDSFWSLLDGAIALPQCAVFSLKPDLEDDPFSDRCLWSFNYFFLNRQLNRVLFLCCFARRRAALEAGGATAGAGTDVGAAPSGAGAAAGPSSTSATSSSAADADADAGPSSAAAASDYAAPPTPSPPGLRGADRSSLLRSPGGPGTVRAHLRGQHFDDGEGEAEAEGEAEDDYIDRAGDDEDEDEDDGCRGTGGEEDDDEDADGCEGGVDDRRPRHRHSRGDREEPGPSPCSASLHDSEGAPSSFGASASHAIEAPVPAPVPAVAAVGVGAAFIPYVASAHGVRVGVRVAPRDPTGSV